MALSMGARKWALLLAGLISFSNALNITPLAFRVAEDQTDLSTGAFFLRQIFLYDFNAIEPELLIHHIEDDTEFVQINTEGKIEAQTTFTIRLDSQHNGYGTSDMASTTNGRYGDTSSNQSPLTLPNKPLIVPDVKDHMTVLNLAKMTSDAYVLDPTQPGWLNTTQGFNTSWPFGWKGVGLRGHVFSTKDNSTVIVAFKGTSIDPREEWRNNDRLNDNRLFSCCCGAQNPWGYSPVCDCATGKYQCNATCIEDSLREPGIYYSTAMEVMQNVSKIYAHAEPNFWTVGHSLGGTIASLVASKLGIPSVTYESPPERLPAQRLGVGNPVFARHFGNTADPVFMGACNGYSSACSAFGFTFESQCFSGKRCVYDTVQDKGWRVSIANHRIDVVIDNILSVYEAVPACEADDECVDCYDWKFS